MKKKSTSQSAFFNLRILTASVFCLLGIAVALFAQGNRTKQTQQTNRSKGSQDAPGTQRPDVVQMIGPVAMNQDLRNLPYVAPKQKEEERRLTRHPFPLAGSDAPAAPGTSAYVKRLLKNVFRPAPKMPGPLLTFEGIGDTCGCQPSDSEGDVGPNHYIEAINETFKIFDKSGNTLSGPTTYNSFFSSLTGTPCTNANDGDPYVLYDAAADRWMISDFAFPLFPGTQFYQCIAVSQTNDPVSGGWFFYALQVDPGNPTFLGDYPKFALWNAGGTPDQNAYFLTMNLFSGPTTFNGVRAVALDRASMLTGGPANAIGFTLSATDVGASYSFVAATVHTNLGDPPPAGRNEMVLAIDSPATGGVTLTQVHARFFHVDFVTPANSVFGSGPTHQPDAEITVNGFVDAFTNTTSDLVPQQGGGALDTLGDKIMTPVVYQNLSGTESLWADQTVIENYPNGPTGVRWYQFDVTGGNFPATPLQQQTWDNAGDGLWRWMPSIAVDQSGNTVIGYSTSGTTTVPSIRYAGRLASDPPSDFAQGEGIMFAGVSAFNGFRWGDYTRTEVDPSNGMDFWHINQYAQGDWHTRIGKFNFVGGGASPTPSPTATPANCSWSAGQDLPGVGARFAGAFFPANGKFYAMGGRDVSDVEFPHPFEYDPVGNSWTTKAASYPDGITNNMACGVLNDSGTDYIYCAGGSQFGTNLVTGRVFRYDPIADVITTVSGADWPPGVNTLPGGFTVLSNQLYILGGFDNPPTGNSTNQIWQFTPTTNVWQQMGSTLPVALGYIPTAAIGNLIYTGGGAIITGGALTDDADSFVFDPTADSIAPIASIPRPTSNTRGLNLNGQMYVLGGSFNAISNEVDIYDPVSDSWSLGPPFVNARRNGAADTDGTTNIWLAGGYSSDGATKLASLEIFNCPQASPTPTATATASVAPSATPTATATASVAPSATPTATATATSTPIRPPPTPRPRPTPFPRPTP
jgi:N-acetylneuraminic acid mutarotase